MYIYIYEYSIPLCILMYIYIYIYTCFYMYIWLCHRTIWHFPFKGSKPIPSCSITLCRSTIGSLIPNKLSEVPVQFGHI